MGRSVFGPLDEKDGTRTPPLKTWKILFTYVILTIYGCENKNNQTKSIPYKRPRGFCELS